MHNKISEITREACERLLTRYESKDGLADALGVTANTLRSLLNGNRRFTLDMSLYVQRLTNDDIKAYELRPDLEFLKQLKIV